MSKSIRTRDLILSDVPAFGETWFTEKDGVEDDSCIAFAASFRGDRFMQGLNFEYITMADNVKAIYEKSPDVLKCFGLTGLRVLLYIEQRRSKWEDKVCVSLYVRAIVGEIRRHLGSGKSATKSNAADAVELN